MIATKGLGLRVVVFQVEGLGINQRIILQAFIEGRLPAFTIGKVATPAFLSFIRFFLIDLGGVARESAFGCDQCQRC